MHQDSLTRFPIPLQENKYPDALDPAPSGACSVGVDWTSGEHLASIIPDESLGSILNRILLRATACLRDTQKLVSLAAGYIFHAQSLTFIDVSCKARTARMLASPLSTIPPPPPLVYTQPFLFQTPATYVGTTTRPSGTEACICSSVTQQRAWVLSRREIRSGRQCE